MTVIFYHIFLQHRSSSKSSSSSSSSVPLGITLTIVDSFCTGVGFGKSCLVDPADDALFCDDLSLV